jgi:outer membrane protein assembly factor BamD (BamD/ComL family)
MRNGNKPLLATLILISSIAVAGCAAKDRNATAAARLDPARTAAGRQSPQILLDEGYRALENQQYNDAIAKADQVLAAAPHGDGTPEALYLKGRSFEAKNAAGVTEEQATANLQAAREAYIKALGENPRQPLNAYIRTSLGNVAYFQDDYQTAISQLTAAYDNLDRDDLKAWALYRTGLSQQRQGQFDQADKTFAAVQQKHPSSLPAQRAREHVGARAFYVQLATYAQPATADKAVADLKKQGVTAARVQSPQGNAYLRVGPIASYNQALYTRSRFLSKYPDALIIP